MGVGHAPAIAGRDGLVFHIDSSNVKSYAGPVISNLATGITVNTGSGTGYSLTSSNESVAIPQLGKFTAAVNTVQNNYTTAYTGSVSAACCPNLFTYCSNITVTGNTTYTYSIVYKCNSGYTNANYLYRYEYDNSAVKQTEGGIHSDNNRVSLGHGWYWAWGTFTTQAATTKLYCYSFYYRYSLSTDKMYVAKVLIAAGTYTGLHPKYWPALNSTPATTASIIDMARSPSTVTSSSVTYANDGSFSFNGSSNLIIAAENSALNSQTVTVEVWIKTSNTTQNGFFFEKGNVNTQYSLFQEGGSIVWRQKFAAGYTNLNTTTASYISTANYAQIVGTYVSGDRRVYINGVQVNSDAQTGVIDTNANGVSIGAYGGFNGGRGYYYNGSIAIVRVYNRVLSAAEVKQNFEALRGRFGI